MKLSAVSVSCLLFCLTPLLEAQAGGSRAVALPLSAGSGVAGQVNAQQNAVAGGGAATVNSSVQVGGAFSGSVPSKDGLPASGPLTLTLNQAIQRGLTANLGAITADNASRSARYTRMQALSALLPNINASASDTVTQVNLAAFGLKFNLPASFANSGFNIPTIVGPYNYSQLQGTLSQSVLDITAIRNWRAAQRNEEAAMLSAKDARELIVLAVGGTYLQTAAFAARVESQKAQVANAEAIYKQAKARKEAGTNARIDVTRSQVELQTEQQRLTSLQAELQKQKLALARLIGVPQDLELNLVEPLAAQTDSVPEVSAVVEQAFSHRADLQAMSAQVRAAETAVGAAHAERYPTASLNGNYGVIGVNPAHTHGVFTVTGTVSVPIWQGGRARADISQAETTLNQRQAELANMRAQVEEDVRTALIELQTAAGQVRVAESNKALAADTLTQSRDRFGAGVATTVEVVQAQQQVANAESDYISSIFSYNLAKLALARATGQAEQQLTQQNSTGKQ